MQGFYALEREIDTKKFKMKGGFSPKWKLHMGSWGFFVFSGGGIFHNLVGKKRRVWNNGVFIFVFLCKFSQLSEDKKWRCEM